MPHTVDLPDETYRALQAAAAARGVSIADLMQSWVATLATSPPSEARSAPRAHDPLAPYLGTFDATVPDLLRRHDDYLAGEASDCHVAS